MNVAAFFFPVTDPAIQARRILYLLANNRITCKTYVYISHCRQLQSILYVCLTSWKENLMQFL